MGHILQPGKQVRLTRRNRRRPRYRTWPSLPRSRGTRMPVPRTSTALTTLATCTTLAAPGTLRLAQAHMVKSLFFDLIEPVIEAFVDRIIGDRVLDHLKLKLGTNLGGNYLDNGLDCSCLGPLGDGFNLLIRLRSRLRAEILVQSIFSCLDLIDLRVRISLGADRRVGPFRVRLIVRAICGVGVQIRSAVDPDRILLYEPAKRGTIPAMAHKVEAAAFVHHAVFSGIRKWIGHAGCARNLLPERQVGIAVDDTARSVEIG